jgi:hypothetical protein
MQATLHLPGATPRTLTADELAALNLGPSLQPQNGPLLRELLGTEVPDELLASEANRYAIIGAENATDYDFGPTPSATADFERLTGLTPDEDEPLVGPLLIIEA